MVFYISTQQEGKKENIAGWSSSVARRAHNPKVVGSNPAPATIIYRLFSTNKRFFMLALPFRQKTKRVWRIYQTELRGELRAETAFRYGGCFFTPN